MKCHETKYYKHICHEHQKDPPTPLGPDVLICHQTPWGGVKPAGEQVTYLLSQNLPLTYHSVPRWSDVYLMYIF